MGKVPAKISTGGHENIGNGNSSDPCGEPIKELNSSRKRNVQLEEALGNRQKGVGLVTGWGTTPVGKKKRSYGEFLAARESKGLEGGNGFRKADNHPSQFLPAREPGHFSKPVVSGKKGNNLRVIIEKKRRVYKKGGCAIRQGHQDFPGLVFPGSPPEEILEGDGGGSYLRHYPLKILLAGRDPIAGKRDLFKEDFPWSKRI